jgi:hypothetical protein
MAVVQVFVLALALLSLVCLPALVAAILFADELIHWFVAEGATRRTGWRQRRELDRLDRALRAMAGPDRLDPTELDRPGGPAIEQVAADLRRLGGQRRGRPARSGSAHGELLRAYDEQLRVASRYLGVVEHLADLDGLDREIERVRVEGELEAAGLVLCSADRGSPP